MVVNMVMMEMSIALFMIYKSNIVHRFLGSVTIDIAWTTTWYGAERRYMCRQFLLTTSSPKVQVLVHLPACFGIPIFQNPDFFNPLTMVTDSGVSRLYCA